MSRRRQRTEEMLHRHGDARGYTRPALTTFLRDYQRYAFTPGPLLALGLVIGLAAALGVRRVRDARLRVAAFLFSTTGLVLMLAAAATLALSPRYELPQLLLMPPALAAGATAIASGEMTSQARLDEHHRERPPEGSTGG